MHSTLESSIEAAPEFFVYPESLPHYLDACFLGS